MPVKIIAFCLTLSFIHLQAESVWPEALKLFEVRKTTGKVSDEELIYWCSTANEKCDDKKVLEQCISWMQELTARNPLYDALDAYARLLSKTGDNKKARTIMEHAIESGKANKEDTRSSEAWLRKTAD